MFPRSALVKESGRFQFVEAGELVGRHLRLFVGQDGVHFTGGGKGAVEDEVAEMLLVLERVGLGEDAAATVAE